MTGPIIIIAVGIIMLLSVLGVLQGKGAGVALSGRRHHLGSHAGHEALLPLLLREEIVFKK